MGPYGAIAKTSAPTVGNVTIVSDPADPQVADLSFDSEILGLRAHNRIWVPEAYLSGADDVPVVYHLHGTRSVAFGPPPTNELAVAAGLNDPSSAQNEGRFLEDARASFIVVTLDAGPEPWCPHCWWVDGRNGQGVLAEQHLYRELIPVVDSVFRVRADRGGRGLTGFSMGASGALSNGFRHPDTFAFVGAFSPVLNDPDRYVESELQTLGWWFLYLASQGYGTPLTDEVFYRNFNPLELHFHMTGANVETMIVVGDGCVPNDGRGTCENEEPYGQPHQEFTYRYSTDVGVARLTSLGVPLTYIQREGVHGSINRDSYLRHFLGRMERTFHSAVHEPTRFSYKTVDRSFSIWGYDIVVDRPNNEFLHVLGARPDGNDFTLAGTGTATVTTPARFASGSTYVAVITPDGGSAEEREVAADERGRITLTIGLGPARTIDERGELVRQGALQFPRTRVEIVERG